MVRFVKAARINPRADYRITGPAWFHTVQNQERPTLFSGLLAILASEFGGSFISPGSRRLVGVEAGAKF